MRTFDVIGWGRMGSALGRGLHAAGWNLGQVVIHSNPRSSLELEQSLGARIHTPGEPLEGEVLFITVPDALIYEVTHETIPLIAPETLVVHCSGVRGLALWEALPAARPDLHFGALHPLQTVPSNADAHALEGAYCAIAGHAPAVLDRLRSIAADLYMNPFEVAEEDRAKYHATATFASNYLTALVGVVEELASDMQIPPAAFAVLSANAVTNAYSSGAREALTGPIRRGDGETVAAHLAALPPELQGVYRALADRALHLVEEPSDAVRAIVESFPI